MAELYAMKEKLLLAGIVVCPTLEGLYAALNSAKARLLGPTSLRIAMPQGRRSTVAGRAKKSSPTTRKMQRRRSEAQAASCHHASSQQRQGQGAHDR